MITYAYMRTRIALAHDDSLEGLWDFLKGFYVVSLLARSGEIIEWDDGLVIKIDYPISLATHAEYLSSHLDKMEGWALFDGINHMEHPKGGALTSFLDTSDQGGTPERYAQIFIQCRDELRESERLLENIRKRLPDACHPVFYFRDGVVLLVKSDISGRIVNQRCRNYLKNLRTWIIIDASGEYHTDEGPVNSVWVPLEKIRPPGVC